MRATARRPQPLAASALATLALLTACAHVPPVRERALRQGTFEQRGLASYYASSLEGHLTADGERYRPGALTAAHRTLPFGSRVRVTCPRTGRSVIVRINDRGPFRPGRIIDLSLEAARRLGVGKAGLLEVELRSPP
ncbi:MAG: septal ring lytic transglycosylase RlpA family protein [Deltaproteobacteria bacterium]